MRLVTRASMLLALSCAAICAPPAASAHSRPHHPPRDGGNVYVNDNTATANTVAAFRRRPDGSLTPLPGSPFATGGVGTGAGIGSQGSLQSALDGRYVLAVDAGSSQISVLAVRRDGSLRPVPGGTVSSGGVEPVSIAIHDRLVYVANAGAGATNYTGFVLGFDGVLHPLSGSTVALPDGSQPGDVLFNATGTRLAATRVGTSLVDSFVVGHDGRLHAAPGAPYAAQGPGPFGSEFSPMDPDELYVSNAHGGAGNGTVSAFRDGWNATLTPIGSSPFADHQTAPCWVEISHDGRYLFAVNTAQPSVSSYAINRDGTLTLLSSTPFRNPAGLGPVDARLSLDGHALFVVDAGTSQVSAFRVHGGSLAELPFSPTALPAGAKPFGIVAG